MKRRRLTKRDFLIALVIMLALVLLGRAYGAEIALAEGLTLKGRLVQGGLAIGHAPQGTRLALDGKPLRLRADGRFLIGFGRDAGPRATLTAILPGGAKLTRRLAIEKRKYRIQRIEGLPPKMVTPPKAVLARIRKDAKLIRAARVTDTDRPLFDSGFIWPVRGRITGVYGSQRILNGKPRRPHFGVDIAAPVGTPVRAAAAGIVRVAAKDLYFTGGTVLIDHGFGLNTAYSHLRSVTVKPDQEVKQGAQIGTLGATGRVTGPHLDWRVNLFLTRLDPALLVPPMPAAKKAAKARRRR